MHLSDLQVQVSQSKQPRVESSHEQQNEVSFIFPCSRCSHTQPSLRPRRSLSLYVIVCLHAIDGIFHVIKLLVSNLFVQLYCRALYANIGDLYSELGVRVN